MASPQGGGDARIEPGRPLTFGSAQQPSVDGPHGMATPTAIGDHDRTPVGPNLGLVNSPEAAHQDQHAIQRPLDAGTGTSSADVTRNAESVPHHPSTSTSASGPSPALAPPPRLPPSPFPAVSPPHRSQWFMGPGGSQPEAAENQLVSTATPPCPEETNGNVDGAVTQPSWPLGDSLAGGSEADHPTTVPQRIAPGFHIEHGYDDVEGHRILRLKPTPSQWQDFPAVLAYARTLGVQGDGCFKVSIPDGLHDPLPEKPVKKVPANAYKVKQIRKTTFWQVSTLPSDGEFSWSQAGPDFSDSVDLAFKNLKRLFRSNRDRQMRNVRYRVDVPAWTARQRLEAGVPERSPIHPLKGDKLDHTKAIIPGIHTPYVYESGPHFGATFQIHAEDFRLASLNHLYRGRKIWVVVPATAVDTAEKALGRGAGCSQFMRHRAEFFFPDKLDKLGIPYRMVDQRPGETIVILPDAYHEGFSTGYTIAEARNYADGYWNTDSYQPCQESCRLATAIPAAFMRPLAEGEERLDLCAAYGDDGRIVPLECLQKRPLLDGPPACGERLLDEEENGGVMKASMEERDAKRIKA
ncbi:jmjC domain, hydroxylase domain-containing protein [Hirsutella rhossiliensis]|uniref:JmjC domain, hydroxylase domain-containing protein n=1 Tax=Hirsutella rhossiliensis TaxID=111463 RepID=A0A9P8MM48_9HYPO|nr:jmjC domain, hydroxylase domain-containing protein [Hirsutella rhossiliensis]KAH0957842.1 jmjC domain, hydroxylase domain-containing protein [Hirsutella rhossiliensis]